VNSTLLKDKQRHMEETMHTATSQEVMPQWLRPPEAERYSGLGRSTLARLIGTGEIKAAKVGKSVRINRISIDQYMERQVVRGDEN
jgi:excisionase family DNA binding protein